MKTTTLLICAVLGAASAAVAGEGEGQAGDDFRAPDLRVLKGRGGPKVGFEAPPGDEMLHRYLLGKAHERFEARRAAIAAIKTPEDVARRQHEMKAFFLRSLGDLPERTPLNARVTGTIEGDDYRIEKVIFESRPSHHVTACLYLPKAAGAGEKRCPGVLFPCGHSDNGKAAEFYQRACILLAKNGMVVFCYDPIGQGERYQRLDGKGQPVVRGTAEHTMAGIGALLIGRQLASYRIWDGMRALDYLAARPEVDPDRLGCTGNSGGGTMTAYMMALDDRIAVAAPSCYITSLERLLETIGPQDAEQIINGQVAAGLDHADYATIRAPRPTLFSTGTRDFFDIRGSWDTFREVKLIYGRLGHAERMDLFESDEPHGFTRPRRQATTRWLKRWLLKKDEDVVEPDFPIHSDEELRCTKSGQVLKEFPDERSVFDLNAQRARALKAARAKANAKRSRKELRASVKSLLKLPKGLVPPAWAHWGAETIKGPGFTVSKVVFETEPGIFLPALSIWAKTHAQNARPLVKIGVDWSLGQFSTKEDFDKLLRSSPSGGVLLLQLRGMGETEPKSAKGGVRTLFGADANEALTSVLLDRPLLGQRVYDVLAVLESFRPIPDKPDSYSLRSGERPPWLRQRTLAELGPGPKLSVVGEGAAGPAVLHAALLAEKELIQDARIEHALVSWEDVLEKGVTRGQLGNALPGALVSYDLPDLAAQLAPVKFEARSPVDALGRPVP